MKNNGEKCLNAINVSQSGYCNYHIGNAARNIGSISQKTFGSASNVLANYKRNFKPISISTISNAQTITELQPPGLTSVNRNAASKNVVRPISLHSKAPDLRKLVRREELLKKLPEMVIFIVQIFYRIFSGPIKDSRKSNTGYYFRRNS